MSNNHHKFPASKSSDKGGRKIKNMTRVIKNIKGKLTPVYVLKFTRRIDKTTLSSVNEPACKIAARIGNKKFIVQSDYAFPSSSSFISASSRIRKTSRAMCLLKSLPKMDKSFSCLSRTTTKNTAVPKMIFNISTRSSSVCRKPKERITKNAKTYTKIHWNKTKR